MRAGRRFRWLLRLLPHEMREAHGADMEQAFRDSYASRGKLSVGAEFGFWMRTILDMLRVAPRQHLEALAQDLKYASRTFVRTPAFTATAVVTIALGVGASTAVFTIVNAVLIRPLPFIDADRVMIVWARNPAGNRVWLAPPELDDIRERIGALQDVAGLSDLEVALTGAGTPEQLHAMAASASMLDVFGSMPLIGRGFRAEDDHPNAQRVVMLSEKLWRRRFAARHEVLGSPIMLDGRPYVVVGVMPASLKIPPPSSVFPARIDVWVPLQPHLSFRGRDVRLLHVVGRLGEDSNPAAAREQLSALGRVLSAAHPEYRGAAWTFEAVRLQDDVVTSVRPALLILLAAVGLVLLIACGNVAALLLSRAASRVNEVSVRVALGASAARLTRQLITEGVALAALGGAAGLTLALLTPALARMPPLAGIPRFADVSVDWRVAAFAAVLSLVTAVLFTIAPLALVVPRQATESLRARGLGRSSVRAGRAFAAGQIAIACVVVTLAVLLSRSFATLVAVDPGFSTSGLLTFRLSLPPKYATQADVVAYFDAILDRVHAISGVHHAGAVTQLPLSGASLGSSFIVRPGEPHGLDADLRAVTPDYFAAMGIAVVEGRAFESSDHASSSRVAIVDELFARRAWPNESAVGKRLRWFRQPDAEIEIVGVVRPVRHRGFEADARETVYRPHTQHARWSMYVAARTAGPPANYAAAIAEAVRSVDPDQPLADETSIEALASRSLAQPGFGATLSSSFAAIALVLTAVGVYGLLAYTVAQRRREIGIRLALGGMPSWILSLIVRDGLRLAVTGLVIGIPAAFASAAVARNHLPHVTGADPGTVAVAVAILVLATMLASWIPARRAAAISPLESLTTE